MSVNGTSFRQTLRQAGHNIGAATSDAAKNIGRAVSQGANDASTAAGKRTKELFNKGRSEVHDAIDQSFGKGLKSMQRRVDKAFDGMRSAANEIKQGAHDARQAAHDVHQGAKKIKATVRQSASDIKASVRQTANDVRQVPQNLKMAVNDSIGHLQESVSQAIREAGSELRNAARESLHTAVDKAFDRADRFLNDLFGTKPSTSGPTYPQPPSGSQPPPFVPPTPPFGQAPPTNPFGAPPAQPQKPQASDSFFPNMKFAGGTPPSSPFVSGNRASSPSLGTEGPSYNATNMDDKEQAAFDAEMEASYYGYVSSSSSEASSRPAADDYRGSSVGALYADQYLGGHRASSPGSGTVGSSYNSTNMDDDEQAAFDEEMEASYR